MALLAVAVTFFLLLATGGSSPQSASSKPSAHIVMLEDSVKNPGAVARRHAERYGLELTHVYQHAVKGYAALASADAAEAIGEEPAVRYVQGDDPIETLGAGDIWLQRIGAVGNANFDLDEVDDYRVDADVAILDDGMPAELSGLDIVSRTNCANPDPYREWQGLYTQPDPEDPNWNPSERLNEPGKDSPYGCLDNSGVPLAKQGHGPVMAQRAARFDGFSGGGSAPGARVWSVRVTARSENFGTYLSPLSEPEHPEYDPEAPKWLGYLGTAHVIAGLDWIAAQGSEIDVANMSIGCAKKGHPEVEEVVDPDATCDATIIDEAIGGVIDNGVVVVAAAGNQPRDTAVVVPRSNPDVLAVSLIADYDGKPGGEDLSPHICDGFEQLDDWRQGNRSYGLLVDISTALPCGGTSGASASTSGIAATLASQCDPDSREDVEFIIDTLMAEGDTGEIAEGGWKDDSGDGWKEPVVNVSDEEVFDPVMLHTSNPELDEEPDPDGCEWRSHQAESDVDSDGRADLVTIDSDGDANVFAGEVDGYDTANPTTSLSGEVDSALIDAEGHYAIDTADVTGDRHADLVTAKSGVGVFVHPGKADGSFGAGVKSKDGTALTLDGGGTVEPIAVADVTGEGRADLIATLGALILTFPGNTDGTFGNAINTGQNLNSALLDAEGHYFLDVVDVTGEELNDTEAPIDYNDRGTHADLVTMNSDGTVRVYKGKADGKFEAAVSAATIDPIMDDGEGAEPVGLGDVDRDRRADLLTLEGETLKLYKGKADGTFAASSEPYEGGVDSSLMDTEGEELIGLLDYSRDGLSDLVSVDEEGQILTYTAQRDATFAAPVAQAGTLPSVRHDSSGHEFVSERPFLRRAGCSLQGCFWHSGKEAQADVDRDGRSDLVAIHTDDEARVFSGTASGYDTAGPTVSLSEEVDPALIDAEGHYAIDTADVTGDRHADLITAESGVGIFVHPGKADGTFGVGVKSKDGTKLTLDGSGTVEPIAVADVTGEGRADMLATLGSLVLTFPGNKDGTFGNSIATGQNLNSALMDAEGHYFLDTIDVTGDGHADLVSSNTAGTLYVYKGKADGKLEAAVSAASLNPIMDDGKGEEPVGLGDANGDRRADLLTLSDADGKLRLRLGNADGTFATATTPYATAIDSSLLDGTGNELIGLLDHGRDGRADLVSLDAEGEVSTYAAQVSGGTVSFAAPVSSGGELGSLRHGESGHEFLSERPSLRRAGWCTASGCVWSSE
ncbi:MAG TPA: FG-GAP-like repeat-containing protein [Solirubrobacterales bacterium]|nr:FG-GAP-like repeat-containing protein [Solirubrobacterales bacterium]